MIQSGNPEGESCYYSGPQLMALGQISPIFIDFGFFVQGVFVGA
jgi:hypothetical protein